MRPLGGHRIAHYLREQHWDIEVVDWSNWWTLEQLQDFFKLRYSKKTVFIGFGHLFSMWTEKLEKFACWIKQTYPHIKLISGSAVNPTFTSKYIDYYIQGFGEYAITALLQYIVGNGKCPTFNLELINGAKVISAIHNYPAFPMKSLMVRYEDRDFIEPGEWLPIELARGCKFSCAFCNFPVLGVKGDYTRDSLDFKIQIKDAYDRFGTTTYTIADETFNDTTDKITKFANVVDQLDFQTSFGGYIRADLLVSRPQDREELLKMNFVGHYYGIESFNNDSAKSIGKGMNTEKLQQGLIDIKKYFTSHGSGLYRASISIIAGLPYDTHESLDADVSWLFDNWQGQAFHINPLMIPKTNIRNTPSKISTNLEKYDYEEMSKLEIDQYPLHINSMVAGIVYWKNSNMNYFNALEISNNVLKKKRKNMFKPSWHNIANRFIDTTDVQSRFDLSFDNYQEKLSSSIQTYIHKKFNYIN
jgi:radical SAM superfamily enzyme YgiQ (UPF0313 family)